MTEDPWAGAPRLTVGERPDDLEHILRTVARLVLRHPAAMQAAFIALVEEGRRFARTPEGQRCKAVLADSELVRRGRALWEGSALNLLEDAPDIVTPSAVIDAVVAALAHPDLHRRVPELLHAGRHNGDDPSAQ